MRSGTSLLRSVLNSHPSIELMAQELRALRYADLPAWRHVAAVHQAFFRNSIGKPVFRRQAYRYLNAVLRGGVLGAVTLDRIHRALASTLAGSDARYVGDKWPGYALLHPQFIHRASTRCVFIHRDARDVVASILERIRNGDWRRRRWASRLDTVEKATDYWVEMMEALGDVVRLGGNALVIRYDDLVTRPGHTLAALAGHLSLPLEGFDASLPHDSSLGRHRDRLSPAELDEVERRAGATLEAWGYEVGRAASAGSARRP